jgi:hypothetical protein
MEDAEGMMSLMARVLPKKELRFPALKKSRHQSEVIVR